jgi:hypothetical protein
MARRAIDPSAMIVAAIILAALVVFVSIDDSTGREI